MDIDLQEPSGLVKPTLWQFALARKVVESKPAHLSTKEHLHSLMQCLANRQLTEGGSALIDHIQGHGTYFAAVEYWRAECRRLSEQNEGDAGIILDLQHQIDQFEAQQGAAATGRGPSETGSRRRKAPVKVDLPGAKAFKASASYSEKLATLDDTLDDGNDDTSNESVQPASRRATYSLFKLLASAQQANETEAILSAATRVSKICQLYVDRHAHPDNVQHPTTKTQIKALEKHNGVFEARFSYAMSLQMEAMTRLCDGRPVEISADDTCQITNALVSLWKTIIENLSAASQGLAAASPLQQPIADILSSGSPRNFLFSTSRIACQHLTILSHILLSQIASLPAQVRLRRDFLEAATYSLLDMSTSCVQSILLLSQLEQEVSLKRAPARAPGAENGAMRHHRANVILSTFLGGLVRRATALYHDPSASKQLATSSQAGGGRSAAVEVAEDRARLELEAHFVKSLLRDSERARDQQEVLEQARQAVAEAGKTVGKGGDNESSADDFVEMLWERVGWASLEGHLGS